MKLFTINGFYIKALGKMKMDKNVVSLNTGLTPFKALYLAFTLS